MTVRNNPHEDRKNSFVTCCDLWPDETYIIDKFFEDSKTESEITLLMCDIPYIHNPNMPESNAVAVALVECGRMDLFSSKVIQSIITFRWQLTRKWVMRKLFMPYLVYFATYIFYVTVVFDPSFEFLFDDAPTGIDDWIHLFTTILLTILSVYFLVNEYRGFRRDGCVGYWTKIWNWVDITPPIMILIVIGLDYYPEHHVEEATGVVVDK